MRRKTILLCILDGFGIAKPSKGNAITQASTPTLHYLMKNYPNTQLKASGLAVGLPEHQMGNSEVGHMHIGAGRVIYQSLTLINKAIVDQSFFENKAIKAAIDHAKMNNSNLHVIGLLSDGGVHSHINHILAILEYCSQQSFNKVYLHVILDGRDTKAVSAKTYLNLLIAKSAELKVGTIASVSGRFYAMDRDKRWERLQKAYDAMVKHKGNSFNDVFTYIDDQYNIGNTDEFIIPAYNKNLNSDKISHNDSIIFANFRPDRAIQLASVLTNNQYNLDINFDFVKLNNLFFLSMMHYANSVHDNAVIFNKNSIENGLGEWISKNNKNQLRIAETEKYAHVTYFFDGGKDIQFVNTERILVPSVKVKTYDLEPAMSARKITAILEQEIAKNIYDLVVLNFANPDMVGHTGNLPAAIEAITVIDQNILLLYNATKSNSGILIITADHGNAEIMIDEQANPNKKHTSQPVPLIICEKNISLQDGGSLANIAPTIIELLNLPIPLEMTEKSLLTKQK